jgi:hypothetical protein
VHFATPASLYSNDPRLCETFSETPTDEVTMGAIVAYPGTEAELAFELIADGPIETIEIRNRMEVVETLRPFDDNDLGERIRIIWEGSEYRGRGRQTVWDGGAGLTGNTFVSARAINFWNLDQPLWQPAANRLAWKSLTTGGFAGVDAVLAAGRSGELTIDTPLIKETVAVADIGLEPIVFSAGGIQRRIKIYRLPNDNRTRRMARRLTVPLQGGPDNAIYLRATTEDGFFIYSSPVYIIRK